MAQDLRHAPPVGFIIGLFSQPSSDSAHSQWVNRLNSSSLEKNGAFPRTKKHFAVEMASETASETVTDVISNSAVGRYRPIFDVLGCSTITKLRLVPSDQEVFGRNV
jgi:hypothetical protein